jgi:hypothetical protein
VKATDSNETPIVLAMLFLQPGKHAGEGGDIDQLVEAAQERHAKSMSETSNGLVVKVKRRTVLKTVRVGEMLDSAVLLSSCACLVSTPLLPSHSLLLFTHAFFLHWKSILTTRSPTTVCKIW